MAYRPSFELPEPTEGPLPDRAVLAEALMAEVERRRSDELDRGVSLVGPHRDELHLMLGPLPVKGTPATASPGPSRWRCGWRRTTCCAPAATTRS